jgi:hypothetical protein
MVGLCISREEILPKTRPSSKGNYTISTEVPWTLLPSSRAEGQYPQVIPSCTPGNMPMIRRDSTQDSPHPQAIQFLLRQLRIEAIWQRDSSPLIAHTHRQSASAIGIASIGRSAGKVPDVLSPMPLGGRRRPAWRFWPLGPSQLAPVATKRFGYESGAW